MRQDSLSYFLICLHLEQHQPSFLTMDNHGTAKLPASTLSILGTDPCTNILVSGNVNIYCVLVCKAMVNRLLLSTTATTDYIVGTSQVQSLDPPKTYTCISLRED